MKVKKYRLRKGRLILLLVLIGLILDLSFTTKHYTDKTGSYSCKGSIIQVCGTDDMEVYNHHAKN